MCLSGYLVAFSYYHCSVFHVFISLLLLMIDIIFSFARSLAHAHLNLREKRAFYYIT